MPDPVTGFTVGASVIGGSIAAKGSSDAANTQANAARESGALAKETADQQLALQREQFDKATALQTRQYEEGVARQQPFLTAGTNALARMQAGEFTQPAAFNANDPRYAQPGAFSFGANDFQADPGYAFRLSEGQKALERSAAARGGLISGGALKAASRYGQDMGSQEYQNAYARALTGYGTNVDRSNTAFSRGLTGYNADVARADTGYNRLAGMAGVGQTTTQQLNAAGQNMASSIGAAGQNYATGASNTLGNYGTAAGNAIMGAGNATAAGQMGVANTLASGLQTAASSYQNQKNFNDYLASRRPNTGYTNNWYPQ
jgi:hypothetical protein